MEAQAGTRFSLLLIGVFAAMAVDFSQVWDCMAYSPHCSAAAKRRRSARPSHGLRCSSGRYFPPCGGPGNDIEYGWGGAGFRGSITTHKGKMNRAGYAGWREGQPTRSHTPEWRFSFWRLQLCPRGRRRIAQRVWTQPQRCGTNEFEPLDGHSDAPTVARSRVNPISGSPQEFVSNGISTRLS